MATPRKINKKAARLRMSRWRANNIERARATGRRYYYRNRERILEDLKIDRIERHELLIARKRRYNRKNRVKLASMARQLRKAKPEVMRAYARKQVAFTQLGRALVKAGIVPKEILQHYGLAA